MTTSNADQWISQVHGAYAALTDEQRKDILLDLIACLDCRRLLDVVQQDDSPNPHVPIWHSLRPLYAHWGWNADARPSS